MGEGRGFGFGFGFWSLFGRHGKPPPPFSFTTLVLPWYTHLESNCSHLTSKSKTKTKKALSNAHSFGKIHHSVCHTTWFFSRYAQRASGLAHRVMPAHPSSKYSTHSYFLRPPL